MQSNAVDYKCPSCGATIPFSPEKQKWVCSYCGSEFTLEELQKSQKKSIVEEKKEIKVEDADIYRCQSCGAEIIADENTTATFCVYCGNTAILKDRIHNSRVPDLIIPFQKVKDEYEDAMYEYWEKDSQNTTGIRIGLGAQYNVTDNVALRAMARYVKLSDDDVIKNMVEMSLGLRYMF